MKIPFDIHPILGVKLTKPFGEFEFPAMGLMPGDILVMVKYFDVMIPGRLRVDMDYIAETHNPTELFFNRIRKFLTNRLRANSGATRETANMIQLYEVDTVDEVIDNMARTATSGTILVATLPFSGVELYEDIKISTQPYGLNNQWLIQKINELDAKVIITDTPSQPWLHRFKFLTFSGEQGGLLSYQVIHEEGTTEQLAELYDAFRATVFRRHLSQVSVKHKYTDFEWELVVPLGTSFDGLVIGRFGDKWVGVCEPGKVTYVH